MTLSSLTCYSCLFNPLDNTKCFTAVSCTTNHLRRYTYLSKSRLDDTIYVCLACGGAPLSEQAMTQRNIDSFFEKGPASPISDVPPFARQTLEAAWLPKKGDKVHRDLVKNPIPSTCEWTEEEVKFFNLHYFQVKNMDKWELYFCPLSEPTTDALELGSWNLGSNEFNNGAHLTEGLLRYQFGEMIYSIGLPSATEAITDHLSYFLLVVCNPSRDGGVSFISAPDASLSVRPTDRFTPSLAVIVVEDKAIGADRGRFQIPGEMVATALRNYNIQPAPQTIFAFRIIGTNVTCYRADFTVDYLLSATTGTPEGNITIFRIGGTDEPNNLGPSLAYPGDNRKRALLWICSMANAAKGIATAWAADTVSPITLDRLHELEQ